MKSILRSSFVLVVMVLLGCDKEESISIEQSISENARVWFESGNNLKLEENPSYYGEPDWQNFIEINDVYYFPLLEKSQTGIDKKSLSNGKMVGKSYLALEQKGQGAFEGSVRVLFYSNLLALKADDYDESQNYINYDSNNVVSEFGLPLDALEFEILDSSSKSELSSKGECTTIGVYLTIAYTDGSSDKILLYTYESCTGDGSDGDAAGGGGDGDGDEEEFLISPSCESFNFQNTTPLWQEAAVTGIRFNIILISPQGLKITSQVAFPQPILFGLPSNYSVGGNLGAGSAAELSAIILKITMDKIVDLYGNAQVTNSYVAIQFRELLIKNYRDYTGGGGRVQFNYSGNLPPTPYKTNFFGTGDCD